MTRQDADAQRDLRPLVSKLIDETLRLQRMRFQGSFATNEAAQELKKCGSAALPQIEDHLRASIQNAQPPSKSVTALEERFPGLPNLWVSYFALAHDEDDARAIGLLRTLQDPLLASAVLSWRGFWLNVMRNSKIPRPVLDYITELAEKEVSESASAAQLWLEQLRKVKP
jgi:hypothetical protein